MSKEISPHAAIEVAAFRRTVELGNHDQIVAEYEKKIVELSTVIQGTMSVFGGKEAEVNNSQIRSVEAIKEVALAAIQLAHSVGQNYIKAHFND